MTVDEFKMLAEERMAGQFRMNVNGHIRHRTELDAQGNYCCPLVALFSGPHGARDGRAWHNEEAPFLGQQQGLNSTDVGEIIGASDSDNLITSYLLRVWMLEVLCSDS